MPSIMPQRWHADPGKILPADPAAYGGPRLPLWVASLYLLMITGRSLVHLLKADGGAHSIATIDIAVAGGSNIVALFGQWGASQLLLVGLLWVLLLRYRGLLPLILATSACEPFLRSLAGHLKPLTSAGVPPGAAHNWTALPVLLLMLFMALCPGRADQDTTPRG